MENTRVKKFKTVFLGTPEVVCLVLEKLLDCPFLDVGLVVTQPNKAQVKKNQANESPVSLFSKARKLKVLSPEKSSDENFLQHLRAYEPDLCVTAAFGQFLPQKFLDLPKFGTLNIHPSLLPKYRGAAPVQYTLLNGDTLAGVSVIKTILAMDAGPILSQEKLEIDDKIQTPELLKRLFEIGAESLISHLPDYFAMKSNLIPQNESLKSLAPKISAQESVLTTTDSLLRLHNKVRAFAGWPGARAHIQIGNGPSCFLKILETQLVSLESLGSVDFPSMQARTFLRKGQRIFWPLKPDDNLVLELLRVQLPGKRAMNVVDFGNGLHQEPMKLVEN